MARIRRKRPSTIEFGRRVRAERNRLGLSQMALAEKVEMHYTYVSSLERGERNITLMTILRLAVGLEVDPSVLVQGIPPEPHAPKSAD